MIRLSTDFNTQEQGAIVLPPDAPAEVLTLGAQIILFKPDVFECEAIVRPGTAYPWVADIVPRTIKYYGGALPLGYPDAPRGWPMDRSMFKVRVDFNDTDDGGSIAINPQHMPPQVQAPGTRIILYDPGELECEAIVRRGTWSEWVADMVPGTIKYYDEPPSDGAKGEEPV